MTEYKIGRPASSEDQFAMQNPSLTTRRSLLKSLAMGGAVGATAFGTGLEFSAYADHVNPRTRASDLKITDLRVATLTGVPMRRVPVIKITTNQGIYGLGEIRDGASPKYALMLKSRLLGENPCDVDRIFRKIKQFGGHGRAGGGVSAVEMALWDLTGKAYDIPVYQLLGGKFRDRVRIYADTPVPRDVSSYPDLMKSRLEKGFTVLKMDLGIGTIDHIPGTITRPLGAKPSRTLQHMFTGIELTPKGIDELTKIVSGVRDAIGWEVPLAADHFGQIGVNSSIRLGKALEACNMAWLEDMVPWQQTDLLKQITEAVNVPILTGEDIYLKEGFAKLLETHAVDMIHPDLATAGGLLETKRIADLATEAGVAMALHCSGSPVSFMAGVHVAAASENFHSLEHHAVDVPFWEELVTGIEKPIVRDGWVTVPNSPGLGIELNEEVVKQHLDPDSGYFEPTEQWNKKDSLDHQWSLRFPSPTQPG
jgi:L-alanine-DL-glutamate epimerase-like enolase superfamily enzyme